jgi:hypothetical protein
VSVQILFVRYEIAHFLWILPEEPEMIKYISLVLSILVGLGLDEEKELRGRGWWWIQLFKESEDSAENNLSKNRIACRFKIKKALEANLPVAVCN